MAIEPKPGDGVPIRRPAPPAPQAGDSKTAEISRSAPPAFQAGAPNPAAGVPIRRPAPPPPQAGSAYSRPPRPDRADAEKEKKGGASKRPALNREIYDRTNPGKMTLLIDPEGEKLGMVKITEAIAKAEELGLDLVQVNPDPMVCRIQDYNKEEFKRRKGQSHNKAKRLMLKELQVGLRINQHDLDIKLKHAREFLAEGHRVQFTMRFRGREVHHAELGMKVLDQINKDMEPWAKAEVLPHRDNARSAILVLAPRPGGKKKGGGGGDDAAPKSKESGRKPQQAPSGGSPAPKPAASTTTSLGSLVAAVKPGDAPKA
ncbi:MAG TPA: translation initiation factor IF-3 [Planctomycetota bacterium]|nr:translation initiation factor IF-3 [Planctomycetota bacterium]